MLEAGLHGRFGGLNGRFGGLRVGWFLAQLGSNRWVPGVFRGHVGGRVARKIWRVEAGVVLLGRKHNSRQIDGYQGCLGGMLEFGLNGRIGWVGRKKLAGGEWVGFSVFRGLKFSLARYARLGSQGIKISLGSLS